jgi:hypothetical protein
MYFKILGKFFNYMKLLLYNMCSWLLFNLLTINNNPPFFPYIGVFEMIISKDFDPLPEDTDPNNKMLIYSMLQKDPMRRPTVWDLADMKCIKDCINRFVEEHGCRESVEVIFKIDQGVKRQPLATNSTNSLPVM